MQRPGGTGTVSMSGREEAWLEHREAEQGEQNGDGTSKRRPDFSLGAAGG